MKKPGSKINGHARYAAEQTECPLRQITSHTSGSLTCLQPVLQACSAPLTATSWNHACRRQQILLTSKNKRFLPQPPLFFIHRQCLLHGRGASCMNPKAPPSTAHDTSDSPQATCYPTEKAFPPRRLLPPMTALFLGINRTSSGLKTAAPPWGMQRPCRSECNHGTP